jgi:hypothetical protein
VAEQDEILAGEGDGVLALADGVVTEFALDGAVTGAGRAGQIGVEALVLTGRNGEVEDDFTVSGGEEIAELDGIGNGVAIGKIEDEAVRQDAGGEAEDGEAVAEGFRINGVVKKAPGILRRLELRNQSVSSK